MVTLAVPKKTYTLSEVRRMQARAERLFTLLSEGQDKIQVEDVNARLNGVEALMGNGSTFFDFAVQALDIVFSTLELWGTDGRLEMLEAREIAEALMRSFSHRKKDIRERFPLLAASVGLPGYTAEILLTGPEALALALDLQYEDQLVPLNCRPSKK